MILGELRRIVPGTHAAILADDAHHLRPAPSRVALLARDEDTWVPKLKGGSEFWETEPYQSTS